MRVGDAYKIRRLAANGVGIDDIVKRFRYSKEEISGFIPKPKRKTRKDKGVKRSKHEPGIDLQSGTGVDRG